MYSNVELSTPLQNCHSPLPSSSYPSSSSSNFQEAWWSWFGGGGGRGSPGERAAVLETEVVRLLQLGRRRVRRGRLQKLLSQPCQEEREGGSLEERVAVGQEAVLLQELLRGGLGGGGIHTV